MVDKLDDKALSNAIDNAEKEIADLKAKKKTTPKVDKKTTVTRTEKKGDVTKKTTVTAKHWKRPSEFVDNPLAKAVNRLADKWVGEKGTSQECEFGESVALTIDYYLTEFPEHPLLYLAISGGSVLIAGLSKRGMIPNFFKEKEEEKPKEPEDEITRTSSKDKKTKVVETDEYQKQKKKTG